MVTSTSAPSRISELASRIQENTARIDDYLTTNNQPSLSFDQNAPADLEFFSAMGDMAKTRDELLSSTLELYHLVLGPRLCLRPVYNGVSLQAIWKYKIASKVPIDGEVSFAELAKKCDLTESNIRRILRYAMAFHHVFHEPRKGFVAHTAASRRLAEDPISMDGLGYMFDEVWPGFAHTVAALEKWGDTDAPTKTGWNHYYNTDKPTWEYYADHPEQGRRFAGAMSCFTNGIGNSPAVLVKGYPWELVGSGQGTVVDVGGSQGHVCVTVGKAYPNLKFIVQDLPEGLGSKEAVPKEVRDQIDFVVHDFFTPQTVEADAYYFRYIFHDWADPYCIKILRSLVPALKPGAKIIINDHILPEPGTISLAKERAYRDMDMIMLTLFNSRERDREDWEKLFHDADPRFDNIKVWNPEEATLGIIEATWNGSK